MPLSPVNPSSLSPVPAQQPGDGGVVTGAELQR